MIEVDGGCEPVVDAHEVPEAMREIVHVRDGYEVFPYSSRASRSLDLDYTIPYLEGVPVQPRSSNLGPLTRRAHRGKLTVGGGRIYPGRVCSGGSRRAARSTGVAP